MKKPMKRLTVILLAVLLTFVGVYGGFCIYTINTRYPAAPLVEYSLGDTVEVNGFSLRAEELTILSEEEMKAQYGAGSLSYEETGPVWYLLVTCTFENKSNEEERLPLAQVQLMSFPDTFAMQYESCAAVNGVQSIKEISALPIGETAKIVFPVAISERMLPSSKCGEEAIRSAEYRLILTNYPERQEIVLSSKYKPKALGMAIPRAFGLVFMSI